MIFNNVKMDCPKGKEVKLDKQYQDYKEMRKLIINKPNLDYAEWKELV
jgi:hypothetical protein